MLHVICTRLRSGHSECVGDSLRRNRDIVKTLIAPLNAIIIILVIIIIIIIIIIIVVLIMIIAVEVAVIKM